MKRIVPLLALCALLAGCNGGSGDSAEETPTRAGGLDFPVAAASDLAPPAGNALPPDLLPPSSL